MSDGKVIAMPAPESVEFACPDCGGNAVMWPRSKPMAVQHSIPICKTWQRIEGKKDDVERYLIKAGVHIHVPDRE